MSFNEPKTVRGKITLQKIVDAAEHLYYEKGFHQTTIKELTERAGVGLGTFYIYFEDKKSLYDYLLGRYSHFIRQSIARKIDGAENRKEAERLGLVAFLEIVRDKPYIYNIIWESLYIDKQMFIDYYRNFAKHYITQIEKAIEENEMKNVDPEVTSYVLMGISNFIGLRYAMFDQDRDLEDVADEVIKIIDLGLFK